MTTAILVRTGEKYPFEELERVSRSVRDCVDRVVVVTEEGSPVPEGAFRYPTVLPGWWGKMEFFSPKLEQEFPDDLYALFDLDMVFLKPVSLFFEEYEKGTILACQDHIGWMGCDFGSALMVRGAGLFHGLWGQFVASWRSHANSERYRKGGDQVWIGDHIDHSMVRYIPRSQFLSYKVDVRGNGVDPSARVINFHGRPKPWEVPEWRGR